MTLLREQLVLQPASSRKLASLRGFTRIASSVSVTGEIVELFGPKDASRSIFGRIINAGWASFAKPRTDAPYAAVARVTGPSGAREISLDGLTTTFPHIEQLPGGELLVAASRCSRDASGTYELNAAVFGSGGKLVRQFTLGDGIEHVQADSNGNIWVGYFDEGVYGRDQPVGWSGLACFGSSGEKIWNFKPPDGFEPISDCYALNVAATSVWTYFYTDFPIARVDAERTVRCWATETEGARALAVSEDSVLLWGGHGDRRNRGQLLLLGGERADIEADVDVALPRSFDISKAAVLGRAGSLYFFFEDTVAEFSMTSIELGHG
jgi:hypothetical protein